MKPWARPLRASSVAALGAAMLLGAAGLSAGGQPPPTIGAITVVAPAPVPSPVSIATPALPSPSVVPTAAAPRRPTRPPLPTADDVKAALRRALLLGKLQRRVWERHRSTLWRTRVALRKLSGARRHELAAALGSIEELAASGRLTASRMPIAFLTLRRNLEVWTRRSFPRPGERMTFGRHPAVFQFYSGRGVHHHPLASFGRANQLARACTTERAEGPRCRPKALRHTLDSLVALASRRGDFTAWEYLFRYGGGRAPWISGMAQATAIQALARGATALDEPRWATLAEDALGAFETAPPVGVSAPAGPGRHYLMYSFNPDLRILNGFLQSLIGLHDVAELTGSPRARRLYERGERAARRSLAAYDTGAWSLYSRAGRESPLGYHQLVGTFLDRLCARRAAGEYCGYASRFDRYEREPTRIRLARVPRRREGRRVPIRFAISKVSDVRVTVSGRRGFALRRSLTLPRGKHSVVWVPGRAGPYRVKVVAVSPNGRHSAERTRASVAPKPKPKKRRRSKRRR